MKLPVALLQERYSPVIPDERSYLTAAHSWKTMLIHTDAEPDRTCGSARRIGYTGDHAEALAIYRLRVLYRHRTVMLPGFFIFQEGFFANYGEEQKQDEDLLEETLTSTREAIRE
jgi:hypothetical protein